MLERNKICVIIGAGYISNVPGPNSNTPVPFQRGIKMAETIKQTITFLADISPLLQEESYRQTYNKVPDFRRQKADRLHFQIDKAQSIGAWRLWMLIKENYQLPPETPFNLSHSGNYVLCSASPLGKKIGCDIETIKDFREPIVRRFFCPNEQEDILSHPEAARAARFYRYWVLKESFMKATRQGMRLPMNTFAFHIPPKGTPYLTNYPPNIKETYYFHEYLLPDAQIAVSSTHPQFAEHLQTIPCLS